MTAPSLRALMGAPLFGCALLPALAQAQTGPFQTVAALSPRDESDLVVVAARAPQDVPVLPQTPPTEAVPQRFPANPSVHTYPRQADGHAIKLAGYNVSRWAEDWRGMADPKKRDDVLDRLKYLPIDGNGAIYVTLSGEARLRMNYTSHPGLRDTGHRREDQLRLIAGADVHAGPLRFFGEVGHADQNGHNLGAPAGKSENDLVFTQAFAELSGDVAGVGLGVRYGRQEFTDGPSSLVTQLDNNSIRTAMNGVRGWAQLEHFRVDAFDFAKTKLGTGGTGDDIIDDSNHFSGVTLGVVLFNDKNRKLFLDPFFWRERNDRVRWAGGAAREVRYYSGVHFWGSLDKLTLDWTLNHQGGEFGDRDIDAWNFAIAQIYALGSKGWAPKAGIHFDYGSGGSYDPDTIRTAKGPASGAIPFSHQGALNITNLFQVSPNLAFSPSKKIDMIVEVQRSWRTTDKDAVYRGDNTAYAGTELLSGSHVGDALRFQGTWKITSRLSFVTRYEYFHSGALLKDLNYGNSHYLAGWFNFRF
jgi:hypothetical protein